MVRVLITLCLASLLTMAGCATRTPPLGQRTHSGSTAKSTTSTKAKTKPYRVMGRTYYPLKSADGYDQVGTASWYGKDFHGKKTANGETYNMHGLSAAHKTLPLGTRVRVVNLENRRQVVLVINDRGPFVRGRLIDLSYGAARKLDMVNEGTARVRITAVGTTPQASTRQAASTGGYYHVRVGAFADKSNADRNYRRLRKWGYSDASITTITSKGRRLYAVQAGSYTSRTKAEQVRRALREMYPSCYIVR